MCACTTPTQCRNESHRSECAWSYLSFLWCWSPQTSRTFQCFLLIKTLLYGHSHYTKSWRIRRLNDIKVWVVFYRKLCFFTATVKKTWNLKLTTKSIKVLISEVGCDMWIHWLITVSADWTKNIQPNTGNLISVCLKIRITVISVVASPRAQCLWTLTFTLEADETLVGLQFLTELNWIAWNAD